MSLLQVTRQYRQHMLDLLSSAEHTITTAWQHMTATVKARLAPLLSQLSDKQQAGEPIPASWLYEGQKLQAIEQAVAHGVSQFADLSQQMVGHTQEQAVLLGSKSALAQLSQIVDETTQPLTAPHQAQLTKLVSDTTGLFNYGDTVPTVKRAIVSGVSRGDSATDISNEITQVLDETRARSLTIANTEGMDAYRSGSLNTMQGNGIQRWRWQASKSPHTCMACVMMDGTIHDMTESLNSHPNCACVAAPLLGDGSQDNYQSGQDWFTGQPEDIQQQILGPAKFTAWQAGRFQLADIVGKTDQGIYEKPLKALVPTSYEAKIAAKKKQVPASAAQPAGDAVVATPEQEAQLRGVEKALSEQFPHCVFDFTGADPELIQHVASQVAELFTKYPDVAATIPYIGTGNNAPKGYSAKGLTGFAGAQSYRRGAEAYTPIFLNPEFFGHPERMQEAYSVSQLREWFTPGGYTIAATITHEFGHALRFFLEQNGSGQEIHGEELSSFVEHFLQDNKALGDLVSGYAKSGGIEEHFAEAFASLHFSSPEQQAEYTKKLGELLAQVLPGGIPVWEKGLSPTDTAFHTAFSHANLQPFGSGTSYKVTIGGNDYFAKQVDEAEGQRELQARQIAVDLGMADRVTPSQLITRDGKTYLVQDWISNGKPLAEVAQDKQDVPFKSMSPDQLTRIQAFEYLVQDQQRNTGNYFLDKTAGKLLEVGFSGMGGTDTTLNTQSPLTDFLLRNQASLSGSALRSLAQQMDTISSRLEQSGLFDALTLQRFQDRISVIRALSKKKNPTIKDWQTLAAKGGGPS